MKDSIHKNYYVPLLQMERVSNILFCFGVCVSIALLFLDQQPVRNYYNLVLGFFSILVVLFFIVNLYVRVYLFARAEDAAFVGFMSNSCGVSLSEQRDDSFFNNNEVGFVKRMSANLLENMFFTKEILSIHISLLRFVAILYMILLLIVMVYKQFSIQLLTLVFQVIFSEQILSKWLRMEWYKKKVEIIYDKLFSIIIAMKNSKSIVPGVMEVLVAYERCKAIAAISLPDKIYKENNDRLSEEWQKIYCDLYKK